MKKNILTFIITAVLLSLSFSLPNVSIAAEFRTGIYTYLAWWEPGFRNIYEKYSADPLLMVGPVLSLTVFDDFTISSLTITNYWSPADSSSRYASTGSFGPYSISARSPIFRFDEDLALTYRINSFLKVFAGYKMMIFKETNDDNKDFTVNGPYSADFTSILKNESDTKGPGCGISISTSIDDNIALSLNTSAVYMKGWFQMNSFYSSGSNIYKNNTQSKYNFYSVGNSTSLSLSYNFSQINTSVVFGGRFQVLKNYSEEGDPTLANDYLYGITLSIIYTF